MPEKNAVKIATEVLDTLLNLIEIDGKVRVLSRGLPVVLNVEGKELGILSNMEAHTNR